MTFATIKSTGRGQLRYRFTVEGWPDVWVTNPSITYATNKDGRNVYVGLSCEGLVIHDRVLMQEGKIDAYSISVTIHPTDGRERPLQSFTRYPAPIAAMSQTDPIDEDDTTLILQGAVELDPGMYHMGTEAIEVTASGSGSNTIVRTKWNTQAQKHNTSNFDQSRWVYVYDFPPNMDGRRCYLHAYGEGDSGAGDGTCVWRGIVSRPPRILDSDGLSFVIDCEPITRLLKQQVAGAIETAHPIAIYHHAACALILDIVYDDTNYKVSTYTGGVYSEGDLVRVVNGFIADYITDNSLTGITYLRLVRFDNGWGLAIKMGGSHSLSVGFGSPLIGTVVTGAGLTHWSHIRSDGSTDDRSGASGDTLASDGREYTCQLVVDNTNAGNANYRYTGIFTYDSPPASPLGDMSLIMVPAFRRGPSIFYDPSAASTWPTNRIFVDKDLTGATAVHLSDTYSPTGLYKVTATGTYGTAFYIDVELYYGDGRKKGMTPEEVQRADLVKRGFDGVLTSATEINVVRSYGDSTSVVGFINELKTQSVDANDGDTPFITSADVATWSIVDTITSLYQFSRVYRFAKAKDLETILAEELKFVLHYPRIESDGRIGIAPLPNFTDAALVDDAHTLDGSGIITPAGGVGAWPGWEPQRDGLASMVTIRDVYDPVADDWKDKPAEFRDPDSIATHKNRGKQVLSIAPYSSPDANVRGSTDTIFNHIASAYLNFFSRDYAVVTLEVSFKHFDCLCGDTVLVSHRLIPGGDGTRGVSFRAGVVIEREWNMDPARARGKLTIWIPATPSKGYAPSALITGQSNVSGNTWNLTCATGGSLNLNVYWSTNNDGQILSHFKNGDFIRIVQVDTETPTEKTGTISGTPNAAAGTCTVVLDASWTPGSNAWYLEFQADSDGTLSTANQDKYAYVANSTLHIGDGSFAEQFA